MVGVDSALLGQPHKLRLKVFKITWLVRESNFFPITLTPAKMWFPEGLEQVSPTHQAPRTPLGPDKYLLMSAKELSFKLLSPTKLEFFNLEHNLETHFLGCSILTF